MRPRHERVGERRGQARVRAVIARCRLPPLRPWWEKRSGRSGNRPVAVHLLLPHAPSTRVVSLGRSLTKGGEVEAAVKTVTVIRMVRVRLSRLCCRTPVLTNASVSCLS